MIQARKLTPGLSSYSTSEQDTGITWIDGKKIYKKTINFGSLPNNASKSVNTGISNMDTFITYEGVSTNGTTVFVLPSLRPFGATLEIGIWFNKTEVTIEAGSDRTGFSAYVTLYYTKTS